jgi:nucleoside triphosphate pyrophosphatase
MRLVLASASPRRAELLAAAGFTFETLATDVDERVVDGEKPLDYVRRLAIEKSAAGLEMLGTEETAAVDGGVLIIGADTAVIVDDEILGKPAHDDDAARMLRRLSGRSHRVLTGVSVRIAERQVAVVEETLVFFRQLAEAEVGWYVASGEGRDKAGAYAIQGLASRFIPRIEGSYSNVVGLPIARIAELIGSLRSG